MGVLRLPMTRLPGTLVAAVLISTSGAAAQTGTITGQVTDVQTGDLIMAAQVHIANLEQGVLTQLNGRYLIQNVPVGTHALTVFKFGYQTVQDTVIVGAGQTIEQNFTISEEAPLGRDRLGSNVGGLALPVTVRRRP